MDWLIYAGVAIVLLIISFIAYVNICYCSHKDKTFIRDEEVQYIKHVPLNTGMTDERATKQVLIRAIRRIHWCNDCSDFVVKDCEIAREDV